MRISDWSSDVCSSDLLRDRIVGTATIFTNAPTFDPDDLIWQSIVTSGFGVEAVPNVAASSFINGPSTRTRGVDFTASYAADFERMGRANCTLSGAYTKTKITREAQTPAALLGYGEKHTEATSED